MHITSDYYRRGANHGFADEGLAGCWSRIVGKVAKAAEQSKSESNLAEPLKPSMRTLNKFKKHYHTQHHLHH